VASGDVFFPQGLRGWLTLVGLAWVSQIAGQGLIAYSLAHLPAAFSSVGLLLQPVIAGLIAWALLGEPLVALQIAGGLMVLLGIWLARHGSTN
jgi:drug/metabolite transporter (DMT)-like permease